MRQQALLLALVAALLVPGTAFAQRVSSAHGPVWDRFTLEPYVGRYYDNAASAGSGFDAHGWLGGLRIGLAMSDRVRLVGDAGYAQVDGIPRSGTGQGHDVFGSQTWLVTGGLEVDVVPGETRGSLSLQAGSAWRDLRTQEVGGEPGSGAEPTVDSPATVIVPGFFIRQAFAPRADLRLGVQDYIFTGADPVSHNWAFTAGITLR